MSKIPFHLKLVQGAVGKRFVVKHYSYGVVITKYPCMKGIKPSFEQKSRRRDFKKAVSWARKVYSCPTLKEAWYRKLRRPRRLFQALMKYYLKQRKEKEQSACKTIKPLNGKLWLKQSLPSFFVTLPARVSAVRKTVELVE